MKRALIVAACGAIAALATDLTFSHIVSDFAQQWFGARVFFTGGDPYAAVGLGRAFDWPYPLLYPAPALVALGPLAWLPLRVAQAIFVGGGAAVLAWALTRERLANPQLLVFASVAMLTAWERAQWTPWLTAAALLPSLGVLFAAKPTIGLALLVAYPSRRACVGAAVFGLVTVLVAPWWVPRWLDAIQMSGHLLPPITELGGPLMLLALLRWRRPEARLLVAMACIPHAQSMYEVVPLFLVVQTIEEGLILLLCTMLVGVFATSVPAGWWAYPAIAAAGHSAILWLVYLPCLVMVLRRPNLGPTPLLWRTRKESDPAQTSGFGRAS